MCRQNITNGNIWLWLIIERMEFSKKNMAKLWPQPPHNHFRIFIWICILISFLRSRKNMSNTLLSIRIWGYYQLYQCSVFTKSRGNIFVTRLELRRVFVLFGFCFCFVFSNTLMEMEEQGKYFCHAPWSQAWSKSAEGRKREKLNSGNNQDIPMTNMIFAGKVNFGICLPKKSEILKGNA